VPHYALFSLSLFGVGVQVVFFIWRNQEPQGLFVLWPCVMFGENRHLFPRLNKGIQAGLHFAPKPLIVLGCLRFSLELGHDGG